MGAAAHFLTDFWYRTASYTFSVLLYNAAGIQTLGPPKPRNTLGLKHRSFSREQSQLPQREFLLFLSRPDVWMEVFLLFCLFVCFNY